MANITKLTAGGVTYDVKDAQARQDVADLKSAVDEVATNFPPGAKSALLSCFEHVAWVDDQGQAYYNALYDALYNTVWPVTNTLANCYTSNAASEVTKGAAYSATITANAGYSLTGASVSIVMGGTDITATAYNEGVISIPAVSGALVITVSAAAKTITGISAVYTQSGTVYIDDDLDSLKSDLVVTATYSDSSTETIPAVDYTLSGDLLDASSTITVTFGTATTTFSVTVTPHVPSGYTEYQYAKYTGEAVSNTTAAVPYLITTAEYANLNAMTIDFDISPVEAKSAATAIIGGNVSTSGSTDTVEVYGRTDTQRISAFTHGTALGIDGIPNMQVGSILHIKLEPGNASPAKLNAGALSVDGAWTNTNTVQKALGFFGRYHGSRGTVVPFVAIGALKLYNVSDDTLAGAYYPCVRTSDSVIGYYDTVGETFHTASNTDCVTVGNANCRYAVGMWGE